MISGFLPSIIKIFEKRQDYKYELELTKLKNDAAEKNLNISREIQESQNNVAEQESVRGHDIDTASDISFFGKLRASVRPIITYCFFFFFAGIKIAVAYVMFAKNADPQLIINTVWDQNTMIIFSAIVSFWFGARQMEKIDFSNKTLPMPSSRK